MIMFSRKTHGCWVPPFKETPIYSHSFRGWGGPKSYTANLYISAPDRRVYQIWDPWILPNPSHPFVCQSLGDPKSICSPSCSAYAHTRIGIAICTRDNTFNTLMCNFDYDWGHVLMVQAYCRVNLCTNTFVHSWTAEQLDVAIFWFSINNNFSVAVLQTGNHYNLKSNRPPIITSTTWWRLDCIDSAKCLNAHNWLVVLAYHKHL